MWGCHSAPRPVCQLCSLLPNQPRPPRHCLRWQHHQDVDVQGRAEKVCFKLKKTIHTGLGSLPLRLCKSWKQKEIKKLSYLFTILIPDWSSKRARTNFVKNFKEGAGGWSKDNTIPIDLFLLFFLFRSETEPSIYLGKVYDVESPLANMLTMTKTENF